MAPYKNKTPLDTGAATSGSGLSDLLKSLSGSSKPTPHPEQTPVQTTEQVQDNSLSGLLKSLSSTESTPSQGFDIGAYTSRAIPIAKAFGGLAKSTYQDLVGQQGGEVTPLQVAKDIPGTTINIAKSLGQGILSGAARFLKSGTQAVNENPSFALNPTFGVPSKEASVISDYLSNNKYAQNIFNAATGRTSEEGPMLTFQDIYHNIKTDAEKYGANPIESNSIAIGGTIGAMFAENPIGLPGKKAITGTLLKTLAKETDEAVIKNTLRDTLKLTEDQAGALAPAIADAKSMGDVRKVFDNIDQHVATFKQALDQHNTQALATDAANYTTPEEFASSFSKTLDRTGQEILVDKSANILNDASPKLTTDEINSIIKNADLHVLDQNFGKNRIRTTSDILDSIDNAQSIDDQIKTLKSDLFHNNEEAFATAMKRSGIDGFDKAGTTEFFNNDVKKTTSQIDEAFKMASEAKNIPTPSPAEIAPRPKPEPAPVNISQIKNLGKQIKELAASGRTKEAITEDLGRVTSQIDALGNVADEMPGRLLLRSKDLNDQELVDAANKIFEDSPHVLEKLDSPDEIRKAITDYEDTISQISDLRSSLKDLRSERVTVRAGEEAANVGMKGRRNELDLVKSHWNLTDNDMKKFLHGRNLSAFSDSEWKKLLMQADEYGLQESQRSEALATLKATINEKNIGKIDNMRAAMELPSIEKMSTEQLQNFNKVIDAMHENDTFLSKRMIENIDKTEFYGARTQKEVIDLLEKKTGKKITEGGPIDVSSALNFKGLRSLGETHPFYKYTVNRIQDVAIQGEIKAHHYIDEVDALIKKARESTKKGGIIPTDEGIVNYLEADAATRKELVKSMTPAETRAAERIDEIFKEYYDRLVARNGDKKFSRFEGQFYHHQQRGFLEALKEDGPKKALQEFFDKSNKEPIIDSVMDDKNLPMSYEQWRAGATKFRSGGVTPTKNAAKSFNSYVRSIEKALALDSVFPEIKSIVRSLPEEVVTKNGKDMRADLDQFINKLFATQKGRPAQIAIERGSNAESAINTVINLSRMLQLGFRIPLQSIAPIGERVMNLTSLGIKDFAIGEKRMFESQGKKLIKQHEAILGEDFWKKLGSAANDIGDKFNSLAFPIYSKADQKANQQYFLASLTPEEYKTGKISSERLAEIRLEMSKYRKVEGLESIYGHTPEAKVFKQYKSWAIPPLTATVENLGKLTDLMKKVATKNPGEITAEEKKAAAQLAYSAGIAGGIYMMWGDSQKLKDKKDRTPFEDMRYRAVQEGLSIMSAIDPMTWLAQPAALSFIERFYTASKDLLTMETNKTTGEAKGPEEFKKLFTPGIVKDVTELTGGNQTPLDQAYSEFKSFKNNDEAISYVEKLYQTDEKTADQLVDKIIEEAKGLTDEDKTIKKLNTRPRAEAIWKKIHKLSIDEQNSRLEYYVEKGIMTDKVIDEYLDILKNNPPK